MKRLIALSLAALLATTALGATMTGASAASGNDNKAPPFLSGMVLWWLLQPSYHPLHPQASAAPDDQWCRKHYRTYNPATGKFYVKRGVLAACVSH